MTRQMDPQKTFFLRWDGTSWRGGQAANGFAFPSDEDYRPLNNWTASGKTYKFAFVKAETVEETVIGVMVDGLGDEGERPAVYGKVLTLLGESHPTTHWNDSIYGRSHYTRTTEHIYRSTRQRPGPHEHASIQERVLFPIGDPIAGPLWEEPPSCSLIANVERTADGHVNLRPESHLSIHAIYLASGDPKIKLLRSNDTTSAADAEESLVLSWKDGGWQWGAPGATKAPLPDGKVLTLKPVDGLASVKVESDFQSCGPRGLAPSPSQICALYLEMAPDDFGKLADLDRNTLILDNEEKTGEFRLRSTTDTTKTYSVNLFTRPQNESGSKTIQFVETWTDPYRIEEMADGKKHISLASYEDKLYVTWRQMSPRYNWLPYRIYETADPSLPSPWTASKLSSCGSGYHHIFATSPQQFIHAWHRSDCGICLSRTTPSNHTYTDGKEVEALMQPSAHFTMEVFRENLYLAWSKTGSIHTISTANGWRDPETVYSSGAAMTAPGMAEHGEELHIVWVEVEAKTGQKILHASTDGTGSWSEPERLALEGHERFDSICLTSLGTALVLGWSDGTSIYSSFSVPNSSTSTTAAWSTPLRIGSTAVGAGGPAMAVFRKRLYVMWANEKDEAMLAVYGNAPQPSSTPVELRGRSLVGGLLALVKGGQPIAARLPARRTTQPPIEQNSS